ncbi:hypothetical protein [Turicimonas muris]|uniref:hypothetical protein n=1 Tax=Turicimonas muris TaxID=1796652 RepID=UPI00262BCE77|nr:hypothetical protein [Turicimonas muris]
MLFKNDMIVPTKLNGPLLLKDVLPLGLNLPNSMRNCRREKDEFQLHQIQMSSSF